MVDSYSISQIVDARIHDAVITDSRFIEDYETAKEESKASQLQERLNAYVERKIKNKRYVKRLQNTGYYDLFYELQVKFESTVGEILEREIDSDEVLYQQIYDKYSEIIHPELWEKVTNEVQAA